MAMVEVGGELGGAHHRRNKGVERRECTSQELVSNGHYERALSDHHQCLSKCLGRRYTWSRESFAIR